MEKTDNLLSEGLLAGYAGTKKPIEINRSGFVGKANDYTIANGEHYHDEWFGSANGGGQELVANNGEMAARMYAGGIISISELSALGLTKDEVISRLIASIQALKGKTRLHEPAFLELPDGWVYSYEIIKKSKVVTLTIGYESITFNDREVFAHGFLISPIK